MIRTIAQFESLRDEWDALAAARRSPLLEHDWFLSCAEAFHADGDLRVVTVRDGGRIVGIAPLVRENSWFRPRLLLLGTANLHEPADWLYESPAVATDLAEQALAIGLPLVLLRVPQECATVIALRDARSRRALVVVRETAPSLGVPTSGSWSHYRGGLSSHITRNLPRVRRKAETALGPMTIERTHPPPSDVPALLESFVAVEGSGWKGRRGSNLGSLAGLKQFFLRYSCRAAGRGRLQVARLRFGNKIAAAEWSIEAYSRMWQLKIGYNEALRAYYPGLQLTAASIYAAFDRGLEAYEFLGSASSWEERWNPDVRRVQTLGVYPLTTAGLAGAGQDFSSALLRRAAKSLTS